MDISNITGVGAITVLCMLVAQGIKATPLDNKWLPVICMALGAVLGVIGMLTMPDYPAGDWLTAAAVGVFSGAASTGVHQLYKQLTKEGSHDTD